MGLTPLTGEETSVDRRMFLTPFFFEKWFQEPPTSISRNSATQRSGCLKKSYW